VAGLLRRLGVATIDTDEVARDVVLPGSPALEEIRNRFGTDLIDARGSLQRDRLAEIVFRDSEARTRLEEILHPRIHAVWQAQVEQWRSAGHPFGAVIIPLLFEKDLASRFTLTLCVACSEGTQQRRLLDRGWEEDEIRDRLASQHSMRQKSELSHCVVWNESSLRVLQQQLQCVLKVDSTLCPGTG